MVDISVLKATEVSRQRQRTYIVSCSICHTWSSVPTLEVQAICREAGVCVACMRNDYFLLKVRIAAIGAAMESIAKRGKLMPEDRRPLLRTVYARKAKQLADVRAQLAELEARG